MRGSGHNQLPKIAQDLLYRLPMLRTRGRKLPDQIAWFYRRDYRVITDIAKVVRDPVHSLMRRRTEFF